MTGSKRQRSWLKPLGLVSLMSGFGLGAAAEPWAPGMEPPPVLEAATAKEAQALDALRAPGQR